MVEVYEARPNFITTKRVEGISFCRLTSRDVVRHPLVQKIVTAYEEYEKKAVRKKERNQNDVKSGRRVRTGVRN